MPLYFAYGSNMDLVQLTERCPSAKFSQAAVINGYRLGFTRFSRKRQGGVADLVPDPAAEVWGGVFRIADHDLDRLDRTEGMRLTPPAYRRITAKVMSPADNQWLSVFTYEVVEKAAEHFKPSAGYMQLIIGGAERLALPRPYIEKLRNVEVC